MACPIPLNLVCDAVGSATSSAAGDVLSAIAGWVVGGATWLVDELGEVITSTTTVDVQASWFLPHYELMLTLAAVVAVPMLVLAAVQAVFQQSAGVLLRAAFVQLPLAALLTGAAVQIVQLALEATDALCTKVTTGTGGELDKTFHSIGAELSQQPLPLPTFVMTVGALLIVVGAFVLWLELLVRAAAIYAAVFFLPLALASLMWPAISHWCRRLTETLVALVLSKFVIVAVLSLAVGAVSAGDGFSTVLAGGALLLLAAFTPFTLLRLIPLVEVGAVMQLEGARQRVRASWGRVPDSAVGFALRQAREHGAHRETTASPGTPGLPGTGTTVDPGIPGPSGSSNTSVGGGLAGTGGGSGSSSTGGRGAGGRGRDVSSAGGIDGASGRDVGGRDDRSGLAGAPSSAGSAGRGARRRGGGAAGVAIVTEGGGAAAGSAGALAGGERGRRGLDPGPRDPGPRHPGLRGDWRPEDGVAPPPGTIPIWPGSPESVAAALEATQGPPRVEPDGYGGIIPGVASPLWGGTEPLSRFEPGPKDDWGAWEADDEVAFDPLPPAGEPPTPGAPPFIVRSPERSGADKALDARDPEPGAFGTAGTERGPATDWEGE